jgi:hemolysin activation/secretion protein
VTKPFSPRELVLRVNAILRYAVRVRGSETADETWSVGVITLNRSAHRVRVAEAEVGLTTIEFNLLRALMQRPGRVHNHVNLGALNRHSASCLKPRNLTYFAACLRAPAFGLALLGGGLSWAAAQAAEGTIYIREYRIAGAKKLSGTELGKAVYPYLGPERTAADVEGARTALETAYREKGFQTVTVEVPEQTGRAGIIVLKVVENAVGRLRVHGSEYFDLERIKKAVPALSPGSVPNFNEVTRQIVPLNKWPDRRVTPALRAGVETGTVDIDLNVEDKLPLHGSVELNSRYSANTAPLRLSASVSYGNLWQAGHAVGFSYATAPQRREDTEILSAYYLLRVPQLDGLTFIFQGTKQESNVITNKVGAFAVTAPGHVLGVRANITLPRGKDFYQSLSLGLDHKHFEQASFPVAPFSRIPLTYWPLSASYDGTWAGKGYTTNLTAGGVFGLRGSGSNAEELGLNRFRSQGNFAYLTGELSHERDFKGGLQAFGRVHGQLANQALVNFEQIAGGGLNTVRGYLEAETLGDNAIFGTLELRSPSLLGWVKPKGNEWRFYAFADGGCLTLRDTPPEQLSSFTLASAGIGSRFRLLDHLNGSVDLAVPLIGQSETMAHDPRVTFRVWADF